MHELEALKANSAQLSQRRESQDVCCEKSSRALVLVQRLLAEHEASLTEAKVKGHLNLEEKKNLMHELKAASREQHAELQKLTTCTRMLEAHKKDYRRKITKRD